MNDSVNRERRLLEIIEMIYSADDDGEMVSAVFPALRGLMPFSSGVLMPVDPDTLELRAGWCFDCSTADMASYLDYCSEMLSLVGKTAALYAERTTDSAVLATISDIESLTTGMSRKIWQKVALLPRDESAPRRIA